MAFSLSSLSFFPETFSRTVACLPEGSAGLVGGISGGPIAIGHDLIGQVQDEALRSSARDWYYWLTEVELSSLSQRQQVRSAYGLKTPLFATTQDYAIPSLVPFQLNPRYGALGAGFMPFAGFTGFSAPSMAIMLPSVGAPASSMSVASLPISGGRSYFRPSAL
ncbi:MAG: hypothetical protein EOP11_25000 [Proteobacteria bacterium]|nr:MAG: hypothetical protein EOP11_25000 [Pseudomonadota bacterium]